MTDPYDKRPATHAAAFHELAGSWLAAQGFALAEDPGILGRFGGSTLFYRSNRGFSLSITFEPFDGSAAWISCGREWYTQGRFMCFSGEYPKLAQRFGVGLPAYYELPGGEPLEPVAEKIIADLRRSLPLILSKLSLSDLQAIENAEPTGAAVNAVRSFGENYSAHVDIRGFSEN
jgi:hypothetical protein